MPAPKRSPTTLIPRHQGTFNHQQRPAQLYTSLLCIDLDVGIDSPDQRVRKALLDRPIAPLLFLLFRDDYAGTGGLQPLAVLDQALSRV